MFVKYKNKTYWISDTGSRTGPSMDVYVKNRYGKEFERNIKKGGKTYKAVLAKAEEEKSK